MFFFFEEFRRGLVCRVVRGRDEGKKVVIHQIHEEMLWCYDNRHVEYRTNRNGDKVIDFDPACVMSPYSPNDLEFTDDIPLQDGGWGVIYRPALSPRNHAAGLKQRG